MRISVLLLPVSLPSRLDSWEWKSGGYAYFGAFFLSCPSLDCAPVCLPCFTYHSCLVPSLPQVIFFLLLAYPLAYVMLKLPSANLKHLFSGILGIWMMQTAHYTNWIHSFLVIVVTYVMCRVLPNKSVLLSSWCCTTSCLSASVLWFKSLTYLLNFCVLPTCCSLKPL